MVHARHCNRAGYADKSPEIPHSFVSGRKGCEGKECPKRRYQKACNRPHRNSMFHELTPTDNHYSTPDVARASHCTSVVGHGSTYVSPPNSSPSRRRSIVSISVGELSSN